MEINATFNSRYKALAKIIDENENGGTSMVAQTVFLQIFKAASTWCKWSHIKTYQYKRTVGTCWTSISKAKEENELGQG